MCGRDSDIMTKSITIRNVPEETRDELAARAARSGRSLQEYLRGRLIELAARPDPEEWVRRMSERKRTTGTRLSRDRIVQHRDADRR
jgi:antitoxin FitA